MLARPRPDLPARPVLRAAALTGLTGLMGLLAVPHTARADGAFPDASQVLLRPDRPSQILVTTNFGLLVSEDDGATFRLVCEEAVTDGIVSQYQLGPPPQGALFASGKGFHRSDDSGCSWSRAGGSIAALTPTDVWPDATDGNRLFAIGYAAEPGGRYVSSLFPSSDGGRSFGAPLLAASGSDYFAGVESARSSPMTVYATWWSPDRKRAAVLRSTDGGARFTTFEAGPALDGDILRLAAVDPERPARLYLRAEDPIAGDALVLSDDGGETLSIALRLGDRMTAFLRRADGTLIVASSDGRAYRSRDGGMSFEAWPAAPHLRGLAERAGRLYAATDVVRDGFAVARSDDDGATWTPLLRLAELCGPVGCVSDACAAGWRVLSATLKITPPDRCFAAPMESAPDAAIHAAADLAMPREEPPRAADCSCGVGRSGGGAAAEPPWVMLVLTLVVVARRRWAPGRGRLTSRG